MGKGREEKREAKRGDSKLFSPLTPSKGLMLRYFLEWRHVYGKWSFKWYHILKKSNQGNNPLALAKMAVILLSFIATSLSLVSGAANEQNCGKVSTIALRTTKLNCKIYCWSFSTQMLHFQVEYGCDLLWFLARMEVHRKTSLAGLLTKTCFYSFPYLSFSFMETGLQKIPRD